MGHLRWHLLHALAQELAPIVILPAQEADRSQNTLARQILFYVAMALIPVICGLLLFIAKHLVLLVAQRGHGIDFGSAPRRDKARQQSYHTQQNRDR